MKIFYSLIGGRLPGYGSLGSSCAREKPTNFWVEEKVEMIEDLEDAGLEGPWEPKLRIQNAALRSCWIGAVAFVPSNPDLLQVLYLQKGPGTLSHLRYAPFIHDTEIPSEKVYVADPSDKEGVKGLTQKELIEDVRLILETFFKDQQTSNLALTYFKEDGSLRTRYFVKNSENLPKFYFIMSRFPKEGYEHKIRCFSPEKISRIQQRIELLPEGEFWRDRILVAAGSCSNILDISFIPVSDTDLQMLYVKRLKSGEDPSSCRVYSHVCGRTEFLLPVEDPCKVFNLKKMSIAATTQTLQVENLEKIQAVLSYFLQDSHAKGIGLTLIDKEEKTVHYVWLKGLFRKPHHFAEM